MQPSPSRPAFRPSVYALMSLRSRARRADDPLAPLASRIYNILKSYEDSSDNMQSLIILLYEFGLEMMERNADTDETELAALHNIESTLIPYQWNPMQSNNIAHQVERYKQYFTRRLDSLLTADMDPSLYRRDAEPRGRSRQ